MANSKELTEYWQELAKKAGVPDDRAKVIMEALSDEAVSKAFTEGFRTSPEYNRGLDKNKSEWEGKLTESQQKAEQLEKWYKEQANPAYEENLKGISTLKKYQEQYGPLDDNTPVNNGNDPPKNVLTREQLEEELSNRDSRFVDFTKQAMLISSDYTHRFKERLTQEDLDKLEQVALKEGIPLARAYESWTAPRIREQEIEATNVKHKKETEEAVRDALSQHNLPVDGKPREHHPFFNTSKIEGEPPSDADKRSHSRDAFLKAWGEGA